MTRALVVSLLTVFLTCSSNPLDVLAAEPLPHTVWMEAEWFGPLKGANFSYQQVEQTTKGSWSMSGPGVAPEWTQGGESEFMSVAARADEPVELVISHEAEAPAAGKYTLWVRYADYRNKKESFGVRVKQGAKVFSHAFGDKPVVDELDQMKVIWDWAFGWDHAEVELTKGPVHVELFTTGPCAARRQIDCLCLTTDASYQPAGREKPDTAAWKILRTMRAEQIGDTQAGARSETEPAATAPRSFDVPKSWKISDGPPSFLWNVNQPWTDELKKATDRVEWPFNIDAGIAKEFVAAFKGKDVPVYGSPLSGPVWHIPNYPANFATGSPFLAWLDKHPDRKFAILLNYGEPTWPKDADHAATYANLQRYKDRFVGYVAGEGISYASVDQKTLDDRIKAAKSRADVLAALRDANTSAAVKKYSEMTGGAMTPEQAWASNIPCLSSSVEAYTHALANWGMKRVGHESTGNSPTLARRLAFLRGAARQFNAKVADYQSCNLGDASTIFNREGLFYPASSRYILDNQYDAWAGAGLNWVLKDYLLFHLAGTDTFYHEEGHDIFWKPGGNSAGDSFPVELSPRGRVTEAIVHLAQSHPRGTQYTPVGLLLDEAHGYAQEGYQPGVFNLDPQMNPAVLSPGKHFASIRGLFDVAYFPAPDTQNDPATCIRQVFVNGIFGDIFDVLVTASKHASIIETYPVLVTGGEVMVPEDWGKSLHDYMEAGGTLVTCSDELSGPGVAALQLPAGENVAEAASFTWKPTGEAVASNVFRYHALPLEGGSVLATTEDGKPVAVSYARGKGRLIQIGIPMGLGIDERPTPVLPLVMKDVTRGLLPLAVHGDVEWTLNKLDDGGWVVGLLNNDGVLKPQHGVNATDLHKFHEVTLTAPFAIAKSEEWIAGDGVKWEAGKTPTESFARITVPAGGVRLIAVYPK